MRRTPSSASHASRKRGACSGAPAASCGGSCSRTRTPIRRAVGVRLRPSAPSPRIGTHKRTHKRYESHNVSPFLLDSRIRVVRR